MTVPASWVRLGHLLHIRILGEAADNAVCVMAHENPDALQHFLTHEGSAKFVQKSIVRNLNTVMIHVVGRSDLAGKTVSWHVENRDLVTSTFQLESGLATAVLTVPRPQQDRLKGAVTLNVDSMPSGSFDRPDLAHMRIKSFLTEALQFETHVLSQGKFPAVNWKRLGMLDNELGPLILEMAFYDANINPVERADRSGRYGALVSATSSDGYPIRRFVALYCTAESWCRDRIELTTRPFDRLSIPDDRWHAHQRTIDKFFGALALRRVGHDESCAALLAGLSEIGQ